MNTTDLDLTGADDARLTWCGKRIDDMTREEAIKALKIAGRLLRQAQANTTDVLNAWDAARKARL